MPPFRQTRTSSSATSWWWGANIAPIDDMTTSKDSIVERQVLGVRLNPLELHPGGLGPASAGVEHLGRQIARRDARSGLGCGDRGVARAGGDVEHSHPGTNAARLDEPWPERQKKRLDHGRVVARRPHLAVARLEL